jgi:hypothetical protein
MNTNLVIKTKTQRNLSGQEIQDLKVGLKNFLGRWEIEVDLDLDKSSEEDKLNTIQNLLQEIESEPDFDPNSTKTTSQKLTSQELEKLSSN